MTSKVQHQSHRSSISAIRLRAATAALALGAVLLLAATAARSQEPQDYAVLHTFTGEPDGSEPLTSLILDEAGNLYGTTVAGGTGTCIYFAVGCGVVFKVDTAGKETVLYAFTGGADGATPFAGLVRDSAGNLYGTTQFGGDLSGCSGSGCGVVFKLDPTGKETVLYSFTGGMDGSVPEAGLIRDAAGNLYGTTSGGGSYGNGTVFKLDPAGHETVLYSFTGGPMGETPPKIWPGTRSGTSTAPPPAAA